MIVCTDATVTLNNVTVASNTAQIGGGIRRVRQDR